MQKSAAHLVNKTRSFKGVVLLLLAPVHGNAVVIATGGVWWELDIAKTAPNHVSSVSLSSHF